MWNRREFFEADDSCYLLRFEKISNIIKQFKLSCSKLAAHFEAMEVSSMEDIALLRRVFWIFPRGRG